MTKIPNRESLLVRARGHYDRIKLYADLHIAEANSGAATLRNIRKGREATPMEKTIGEVIGWVDLTDLEKTQDSLNTATRHIQAQIGRAHV